MDYKSATLKLGRRDRRKLANNTYLERRPDGSIAVRLHSTDVLTFLPSGRCIANSGGWKTPTTKDRINSNLPHGWGIWQENGVWIWRRGGWDHPAAALFSDGDWIGPRGALTFARGMDQERKMQSERKRIRRYAKLYAAAIPLDTPGPGDCFYCQFTVESPEADKGKALGDVSGADHLESHIEEGYIVPSLAYRALQEAGNSQMVIASAFKQPDAEGESGAGFFRTIARERIVKAVFKYVSRRLGMVR